MYDYECKSMEGGHVCLPFFFFSPCLMNVFLFLLCFVLGRLSPPLPTRLMARDWCRRAALPLLTLLVHGGREGGVMYTKDWLPCCYPVMTSLKVAPSQLEAVLHLKMLQSIDYSKWDTGVPAAILRKKQLCISKKIFKINKLRRPLESRIEFLNTVKAK